MGMRGKRESRREFGDPPGYVYGSQQQPTVA
jgi:hypothetical protein